MSTDTRIDSDLQRLARATLAQAPLIAETERLLRNPRAERMSDSRRWPLAAAFAIAALVVAATQGSTVYAFTRDVVFRVVLDLRGKNDVEATEAIQQQVESQGWTAGELSVERTGGERRVIVKADSETGRHVELHRLDPSDTTDEVVLAPEPIDDAREPGMTDVELRDKILQQLRARGIEHPQVTVSGDDVRVLIKRGLPE